MAALTEISVPDFARLIGTPRVPIILDVRIDADFAADPRVTPTARRIAHGRIGDLAPELAGARVVVTCQRGAKLSQGAAALLRSHGIAAESLEGGHEAWAGAGEPLIPAAAIPPGGLWVTRARPKIDRIACPWLIRRFVDPGARFLFVPAAEVEGVASRFGAKDFDMPDGFWSHRGDQCTFDTMLAEWSLASAPLQRMARIIRAADTDRHELAPEAAGLLAISVGLSRQYRDNLAQLDAGMAIYDALFAWARDGQGEGHGWPHGVGARG